MTIDDILKMLEGYDHRMLPAKTLGANDDERLATINALKEHGWKIIEYPPMSGIYDVTRTK